MKRINLLGFISLFALIGILGFITENKKFLGFWGFLYYAKYFTVIPDEMFKVTIKTAASLAFFFGFSSVALAIPISYIFVDLFQPIYAFYIGYVVSVFTFTIVLTYLEHEEQQGM
ncbi:MAG: DUF3796 domain-containing protein [Halanaerobiales bacterium]|nr:DUF3796 domain-containing protein [Halanaerobiales bacterium]